MAEQATKGESRKGREQERGREKRWGGVARTCNVCVWQIGTGDETGFCSEQGRIARAGGGREGLRVCVQGTWAIEQTVPAAGGFHWGLLESKSR